MSYCKLSLCAVLTCGVSITAASAQQLNPQQIQLIRDTAASVCNTVREAKGHKSDVQLQGDVKAQLGGLVGKVVDVGGSGKGSLTREEFEGLSREATATALGEDRGCRERVFNKMFDKLSFQESIPHDPSPPPPPQYAPGLLVDVFMTRCMPGCPGRPEGTQVARRVLDRRPPTFGYGVVQKLESRYRNNTSLGFLWTGLLQVTDSGLYSFNLVPISPAPCQGNVKIENQLIIDWFNAPTAGGKVSLDPGFHALEIWMFCRNPSDYQHVNYNLQMLGPGDERIAPIPSTRLVHERAESGPLRPSAAR